MDREPTKGELAAGAIKLITYILFILALLKYLF